MGLATFALVAAMAALAGLLALTAWQNRDIAARLRGTGRPPARVLGVALRLWSPVALAIVLATLVVGTESALSG